MSADTTESNLSPVSVSLPEEAQPRLVQLSGKAAGEVGRVLLLDQPRLVIGRGEEGVQFLVNDIGVSRRHAAIVHEGDTFRLVDFDSRNGTLVNNVRVKTAELHEGDRIQLGSATLLRFTLLAADDEWQRQSLDHGGVALWELSLPDRTVTWSRHTDGALHLSPGTLSNRSQPLRPMLHPEDEARVQAALERSIETGAPFEAEFRLLIGATTFRWVLCRGHLLRSREGRPGHITGTVIDVTGTKSRELDLRRVAVLFESLSDGAFLTNRELKVVDLNSSALRLFGLSRPRALGARLFELLGARDGPALETQAAREFEKEGRWSVELALGPNTEQTFELVAFPLRGEADVVGAAFLFRDLTERKKLQRQLAFYDRLSSLGTLSAGIAHEINNPLSFVVSSLEFVLDEMGARPEARQAELDALRDALEGARRIGNTVKDMKTLSRDDGPGQPEPTDARQQLDLAIKMTQKLVSSRAVLVLELAQGLPPVTANRSRLSQVFINLLVNAAQAIPEGKEGRIVVRQWAEDGLLLTDVTDNGVGIPPENLSRIFDPFFTTKPVGVGTGLGLSICHGLVTGFGGELKVDSAVGRGTTFTVKLPMAVVADAADCDARVPSQRRARLLLIDDEPLLLRSLSRTLGALHEVSTAGDVEEALVLLRTNDYDIILCDLMMPGRTGMDLYDELNRDRPELATRLVFVSGGAFTDRAREFVKQVPNLLITKPIDRVELANLVQLRLAERTGPT